MRIGLGLALILQRFGGGIGGFLIRDFFTTEDPAPIAGSRTAEPGPGTATIIDTESKLSISDPSQSTTFLLQDEFTQDDGAPIESPRTSVPGPGALVAEDNTKQSISGGEIISATASTFTNAVATSGTYARAAGLMAYSNIRDVNDGYPFPLYLSTSQFPVFSGGIGVHSGVESVVNTLYVVENQREISTGLTLNSANYYKYASILRTSGSFILYNNGASWKLLYVGATSTATPLYAGFSPYQNEIRNKEFRVAQLGAPWDTDNGIATDSIASPSEGNTFTHEADMLLEFVVDTLSSSGNIGIRIRKQDDDNRWGIGITPAGDLELYEIVGALPTLRGSAAGALSGGERIVVVADDETITVYYDNTQAFTYGSASNFKTETAGEVSSLGTGGALSAIKTWPRILSGAPLTELETYTAQTEPQFLLQDEFTQDDSAPIESPRTSVPGPGTLTFVENDGTWSISSGVLNFTAQSTPNWGDLGSYDGGHSRAAGLMASYVVNKTSAVTTYGPLMGFSNAQTAGAAVLENGLVYFANLSTRLQVYLNGYGKDVGSYAQSTEYICAHILRGTGSFSLIKGGAYTNWTLLWVDKEKAYATVYNIFNVYNAAGTLDSRRIAQLGAPWNTDDGIVTDSIASPIVNDTFTHEADCVLEFVVTTIPSGGFVNVVFRRQDAQNQWIILISASGNLSLFEEVADSLTSRGAANGVLSGGERIVVIADDETITVYYDNTQAFSYSSAANFKTETSGVYLSAGTGGALSAIKTWPRILSGEPLTELETYTA